ncbi:MAG: HU family DNA-binding protein [Firmicutes bacterium]|nr:HU family DNA-binding protein [Bacillota bacterium]
MNKSQFVEAIAKETGLSTTDAAKAVNAYADVVKAALKKNDKVQLVGFGTFSVSKRAARQGINPATGEKIKIKAANVPKFKAGAALKDALN